jgi:aminomethyltransferase
MKNTALTHIHESLGAKMVPFAGYKMPVQYEGVKAEHLTVRSAVGVFDVSHMGEFLVEGSEALTLLQKVTSNDVSKLAIGDAQYSCFPNDEGGIIDDLICYRIKEQTYLLVVNASNIEKDWNWIQKYNKGIGAELKNISDNYSLLAIQGPKAIEAMQSLTSVNLSEIPFYKFKIGDFAGIDHVIISATGYTGSGGFEIYVKNDQVEKLWEQVFEAGASYGNDINDTTSPLEAGLGWITKFTKDFVNSANLKAQKETGITKKLVAFELTERGIPRLDYAIVDVEGKQIGVVTSGTMSPSLSKGIGMGYVPKEISKSGNKIFIQVRKKQIPATIIKLPFYKG